MSVRDKRRDKAGYDATFTNEEALVEETLDPDEIEKLEQIDPVYRCTEYSDAGRMEIGMLDLAYARGDSRAALRPLFERGLSRLWQGEACFRERGRYSPHDINLVESEFSLLAVAFGEGLGFERAVLARLAACIPAEMNALVDRVLAVYLPDRPIAESLRDPGKYRPLLKLLDAEPDKRPGLLKKYLDSWPRRLGPRGPEGPWPMHQSSEYRGYWCFEAAAVVAAFGIDDSGFIDHEYYPGELMRWRKDGDIAQHQLPLEQMPLPDYNQKETAEERHARKLARLKPQAYMDAPAELAAQRPLFDALCAELPETLRQMLWNSLVVSWEDLSDCSLPVALSVTEFDVDLYRDYGKRCVLHVDWKDLDSALSFTRQLIKSQGIEDEFDLDPTEAIPADEPEPIVALFREADRWLQARGYRFIQIETGGDSYMGTVHRSEDADSVVRHCRTSGLECHVPV